MTPKASEGGRHTGSSFKGAFLYYTHDKRSEGEETRLSSDRMEWAEFRNLATDKPHVASSIMAATARQQDEIKRAAGRSAAGNKSDQVVFHYSLGWHPDEKDGLSKSEMLRAADESIRALGAEGHQAAIFAHNDTAHPHVHVVINRVNPEHGKMLDLWNYQKKLSKWAMAYEQGRGQVYCDKRVENWKRRDLGDVFSAKKDAAYHLHDQAKALGHANDNDKAQILAEQKAKDAELAAFGAKMNSRHSAEWKVYSRDYHDTKAQIFDKVRGRSAIRNARADVKEQFKPLRSQLGRQQWHETKAFEKKEHRVAGKLENALAAIRYAKEVGRDDSKGFASMAFNFLTSKKARADALDKWHKAQWKNLNSAQSAQTDVATAKIKQDQQAAFSQLRGTTTNRRQILKDTQDAQRADLQRKWATRKLERNRALEVVGRMDALKEERKAAREPSRGEQRAEFNKAARGTRKRKGRVRKQER